MIASCKSYEITNSAFDSSKDIVILYSFIVPGGSENIDDAYSKIKETKESVLKETPNVTLVEAGNNANVEKMNDAEYNYACFATNVIGDNLESAYENTKNAKYKYLLCSASYNGQTKDVLKKTVPYEVVNYDGIKVGYIGVLSPTYLEKKLSNFTDEEDKSVNYYNETEEVFYDTVQCSIDKAKAKGAEYIVLLSQFDEGYIYSPYSLEDLIANLSNVDIVMNESLSMTNEESYLKDKDSKDVFIISSDSKFSRFGKVTISDGAFTRKAIENFY